MIWCLGVVRYGVGLVAYCVWFGLVGVLLLVG